MQNIDLYKMVASDFEQAAALAGLDIPASAIFVDLQAAPHKPPPSLPPEKSAVYVFIYGKYGLTPKFEGQASEAANQLPHPDALARAPSTGQRPDPS